MRAHTLIAIAVVLTMTVHALWANQGRTATAVRERSPVSLEVRLVLERDNAIGRRAPHPTTGQSLLLAGRAAISNTHVDHAEAWMDGDRSCIVVHLTERGAARMAELYRLHLFERLAIFLDGELVFVPFIKYEQATDRVFIRSRLSLEKARRVAAGLTAGI
jgi:preprotein translocase subunit SecD